MFPRYVKSKFDNLVDIYKHAVTQLDEMFIRIESVSYTHLDVYKRQVLRLR